MIETFSSSFCGSLSSPMPLPEVSGVNVSGRQTNYFVFLGSELDSLCLITDEAIGWTSHRAADLGDEVFFYITAPVSAIVAQGVITSNNWLNEDVRSKWEGRLMTEIVISRGIDEPKIYVSMRRLREIFPEWSWLRYPRQNTQIPADIILPFLELMK